MTLPSREELRALRENAQPPCVSLYMPTHRSGYESQQDPIRFKNLLRRAEEHLLAGGWSDAQREVVLAQGRSLVDDTSFWQLPDERGEGLAVFLARGTSRRLRLPERVRELVVVNDRFHLGPLLGHAGEEQRFHVLALSQKSVRLFEGTRERLREIPLRGVPRSVQEALHYTDSEHSPQRHAGSGAPETVASRGPATFPETAGAGSHRGQFHGHGVVNDDAKEQMHRFLEVLADALVEPLQQNRAPLPLVLAGVEYELVMFRQASKHPRIVERDIEGNPETLGPDELHARAWPLVEPALRERARKAAAQFEELAGSERASAKLEEIVLAALDGRVDVLFYDARRSCWGRLDAERRRVELHDVQYDGDEDLLERAATETFFHGGSVYGAGEGDEAPGGGAVAALFRY